MKDFQDHFSQHAQDYQKYRPVYPEDLYRYLASQSKNHTLAWDCATGNGQAAHALVSYFSKIIATDASKKQIDSAVQHEKIEYRVARAEDSGLQAASIDLITVAQAIHWFDHACFYKEVKRVLKPSGLIAVWVYGLHQVNAQLDSVIHRYYADVLGSYWPPERQFVDEKLNTLPFPFKEINTPHFFIETKWSFDEFLGYLSTWSAAQKYREATGQNPIEKVHALMSQAWGGPQARKNFRWPIYLRVGRLF